MFKRWVVTSIALAVSCGTASAYQYYPKMPSQSCRAGKPFCVPIYSKFDPASYFGLSLGLRNNYSSTPVSFTGLDFTNLSFGYGGLTSCNCYFAGEIFGLATVSIKNYTNSGIGGASTWGVGASILPGMAITKDTIIYTRLGPILSHFSDQSTNRVGWQAGLGGEVDICPTWGLRGEYVYTWYGSVGGMSNVQSGVFNMGVVYRCM